MKKSLLLLPAAGCLIAAAVLIPLSYDAPATAAVAVSRPTKVVKHVTSAAERIGSRPIRPVGEEDANLTAWRARYETLLAEHGDAESAATTLFADHEWKKNIALAQNPRALHLHRSGR